MVKCVIKIISNELNDLLNTIFYPTRCVFSIPKLALLGDGQRTRCVKIIYYHKLLKVINIFEIILIRDDDSDGS